MGVNLVNLASQEAAVAASQAAITQGLESPQGSYDKKIEGTEIIKRVLSGEAGKLDTKILSGLIQEMAALGITPFQDKAVQRASLKAKDEYEQLLAGGKQESEDKIELSRPDYLRVSAKSRDKDRSRQDSAKEQFNLSPEAKETVREYIDAYASFVVNGSAKLKEKIEQLEKKLEGLGVSHRDLLSLQKSVKQSIRSEIAFQIKDAYLKRVFAPDKSIEYLIKDQALNEVLDAAVLNEHLGKEDFGGYNTDLQGTTDRVLDEARGEVRDFIKDEMENTLIRKNLTGKDVIDDLDKLLKVGRRAGFNPNQFIKDWKEKKDDLLGIIPAGFWEGLKADVNSHSQGEKEKKREENEGEKNLYAAQLRALFMERALKGDFMTVIATSFKMRRLRSGLLKLGITYEGVEALLRKADQEGRQMAVGQLREMLSEALVERASFYRLSGPAYKFVEDKINAVMANLKRLGVELDDAELKDLRDRANLKMFNVTLESLPEAEPDKRGRMLKVLHRLSSESKIPLPPNLGTTSEKA